MSETVNSHPVSTFTTPAASAALASAPVRNNFNTMRDGYTGHDSDPGIHLQYCLLADLPVAGTAGRKYITRDGATSRLQLWRDNGSAWQEVTGTTFGVTNGQPGVYDAGNSGTSIALDWNNGPIQKITLTGNATVTFSNAVSGSSYTLILTQDGTGGRTVSLTGWDFGDNAPSYNTSASKKNVVSALYDGTEYLAAFAVKGA